MKLNSNYLILTIGLSQGALDFGICNGFVYYITANGEIWLNSLSSSSNKVFQSFNEISDNRCCNFFRKNEFIKIASLNSFPIDSLTYRNKLFVYTEDGTFVLNLSLNPSKTDLKRYSEFKPISVTKVKDAIFFSFGEKGFIVIRPSLKDIIKNDYNIPSSQIIANGDTVLNIFPDTIPELFKISSRDKKEKSSILLPIKEANEYFKKIGIIGRDIIAPYFTPDKLVLPTLDKDYITLELYKNESEKYEIRSIREPEYLLAQAEEPISVHRNLYCDHVNIPAAKSNEQEERDCLPVSCNYFQGGYILEYWDKVVYRSKSFKDYTLIENEEICQLRTYTYNPRYSNIVTVATEKACYMIHIPTEENFEDTDVQIIDPRDSIKKLIFND